MSLAPAAFTTSASDSARKAILSSFRWDSGPATPGDGHALDCASTDSHSLFPAGLGSWRVCSFLMTSHHATASSFRRSTGKAEKSIPFFRLSQPVWNAMVPCRASSFSPASIRSASFSVGSTSSLGHRRNGGRGGRGVGIVAYGWDPEENTGISCDCPRTAKREVGLDHRGHRIGAPFHLANGAMQPARCGRVILAQMGWQEAEPGHR